MKARRITIAIAMVVLMCMAFTYSAFTSASNSTITLQPGWPISTGDAQFSSLTLGDVDSDGDLEIVVGTLGEAVAPGWQGHMYSEGDEGRVYVINSDGSIVSGWPGTTEDCVYSAPALGDIDGDGLLEVIVGTYRYPEEIGGEGEGKVYAWNGDGSLVSGWPLTLGTGYYAYSSPALGDIDGDGKLEVVCGVSNNRIDIEDPLLNDGKVYVWNGDGSILPGWPVTIIGWSTSTPALGDIDDDGELEIVVSTWLFDVYEGKVYALEKDGSAVPGWPKTLPGYPRTPVVGDVDDDDKLDVFCVAGDPAQNGVVYAWNSNGSLLSGWPVSVGDTYSESPLALGDMDQDGVAEIVVASDQNLWVFNGDGSSVPGWPATVGKVFSSPVIGNIDSDRELEVVIGWGSHDNRIIALNADGSYVEGWPLTTSGWVIVSPALGDIDGDGATEVVAPSFDVPAEFGGDGFDDIYCWDMGPSTYEPNLSPWPMIHHDMYHTNTATVESQSMEKFFIGHMTIHWAKDIDSTGGKGKFGPRFKKWRNEKGDLFSIFGRMKLPDSYTSEHLKELATVTITIPSDLGNKGNDTVTFEVRPLRRLGVMWTYRGGEQPLGEGMNITKMTIWWAPQGSNWEGWAGFYISGELELPDVEKDTEPAEALVTLEIPVSEDAGSGSVIGKETVEFKVSKKQNLWTYHVHTELPHFPFRVFGGDNA